MGRMQRLVDLLIRLARRSPYEHLQHADGSPYMYRYWLMPRWMLEKHSVEVSGPMTVFHYVDYWKPRRWVPFSIRLHQIVTSDYDRDMHSHPWSFLSLVLRGRYVEARPLFTEGFKFDWELKQGEELNRKVIRRAGSLAFRRASDRHRIRYVDPDTWTLVIAGRKTRDWGFYTPKGFVPWREYTGDQIP